MKKKLGPLLLSGLMIGPILGSGIVLLPPIAYQVAGSWAFPAWCIMILLGFFFAQIFSRLAIMFPGDAGVATAISHTFGPHIKKLTAYYLIGAVLFGPVAVMLTAAQYLHLPISTPLLAIPITILCSFLLLREITLIGKISLFFSTAAALCLFIGGLTTLLGGPIIQSFKLATFEPERFGYCLLLLFWTIVGWEVVGNYSGEVRAPEKTIPRAVNISITIIAVVSLTVAASMQIVALTPEYNGDGGITAIITPLFGGLSNMVMGLLTLSLCITTYLLFVGGVARLICSLAVEKLLPAFLGAKTASKSPIGAIAFLTMFYLMVLTACEFDFLDTTSLVALADGFFLANAIIGLLCGVKLINNKILKVSGIILALCFIYILCHASTVIIAIIVGIATYQYIYTKALKKPSNHDGLANMD